MSKRKGQPHKLVAETSASSYPVVTRMIRESESETLKQRWLEVLRFLEARDYHKERGWPWPHSSGRKCECQK